MILTKVQLSIGILSTELSCQDVGNPCPTWLDDRGTGQWKWTEEVPRCTSLVPLAFPCFVLCLIGVEAKGLLDYQGRAGIISIVQWNLHAFIFGVEKRGLEFKGGIGKVEWGSGKKKAHKHKLFCPVGLGTTPGFLLILHSGSPISPGLSLGQTRFVPGTIPGTKGGTESLREKSLCAFSLARGVFGREGFSQ